MLLLIGKTLGVTSEPRSYNGDSWIQTEIHLLDGMRSLAVRASKDFPPADLPREGEFVVVEVAASAYKTKDGSARSQLTAFRRRADLEDALDRPALSAVNE